MKNTTLFGIASRVTRLRPRQNVSKPSFLVETYWDVFINTKSIGYRMSSLRRLSTSVERKDNKKYSYDLGVKPYIIALASKTPTPGGGSASAICSSIGLSTGAMAAIYTKPKSKNPSLDTVSIAELAGKLQNASLQALILAQKDEEAFAALERTWKKDSDLSDIQRAQIKKQAQDVPLEVFNHSYNNIVILNEFLPYCSKNIMSDAKVSIHLLSGSARAAFQTVLVNKPSEVLIAELQTKLKDIERIESELVQS